VLPPITPDGSSFFKQGSTVPVKFALTGPDPGRTSPVATLTVARIGESLRGTAAEAVARSLESGSSPFRYDARSGQYIHHWSTRGLTPGRYELQIDLGDGVPHTVRLTLK
jgi:hypothetical protein